MFTPQENQVVPSTQLLGALTQLLAVGGPFHLPTLQAFQSNTTPTIHSVYSDFTIANFTGYADVAGLTFSAPYFDVDGTAVALGADTVWIATGAVPANTIYGYLLANAGLTQLIAAYRFPQSVGIAAVGQAVACVPFVRYSGT
jgi:hypothetical protein